VGGCNLQCIVVILSMAYMACLAGTLECMSSAGSVWYVCSMVSTILLSS